MMGEDGTVIVRPSIALRVVLCALLLWTSTQVFAGVYFIHPDHLGTPVAVTSSAGETVWRATIDPFGNANVTTSTVTMNLRFPGQYFDAETGVHYNYFRDYDPVVGRYLQSDPIGLEGGINTYAYTLNNPIRYTDPTGEVIPLILGGAVLIKVVGGAILGAGGEAATQFGSQLFKDGKIRVECLDRSDLLVAATFGGLAVPGADKLFKLLRHFRRVEPGSMRHSTLYGDIIYGAIGGVVSEIGVQAIVDGMENKRECDEKCK